jgi:hypothetical protein
VLVRRRALFGVLVLGCIARTLEARADAQASLGVMLGGAVRDAVGPAGSSGAFYLGGRGDLLLLASGPGQMAIGPYVEASTVGFHDANAGGGAEWLLPLTADLPIVLSAGGFLRAFGAQAAAPGVEGSLFFGSRSYNFHSLYGLAFGIFGQTLWVPASSSLDAIVGARIDAEILALPVLLVYEAIRH